MLSLHTVVDPPALDSAGWQRRIKLLHYYNLYYITDSTTTRRRRLRMSIPNDIVRPLAARIAARIVDWALHRRRFWPDSCYAHTGPRARRNGPTRSAPDRVGTHRQAGADAATARPFTIWFPAQNGFGRTNPTNEISITSIPNARPADRRPALPGLARMRRPSAPIAPIAPIGPGSDHAGTPTRILGERTRLAKLQ